MPSFAGLSKFFGRTASEGAAFAAGVAVAPALSPVVREIVNEANAKYSTHPLSPGDAAAIVAEDVEQLAFGVTEASYNGVDETRFRALLGEVLNAPGIGELFEAYRRDLIDDATFTHGLRKAKLEPLWDAPLRALKAQRLGPDVIARAIQRGLVPDPGLLPVAPPAAAGKVPAFPVFDVDALQEAAAFGIDRDRLGVEVGLVGNPASPDLAARMVFRDLIDRVDFDRAIAEGNTRNEWADALFEGFRQIVTAHDGIEGRLRGWLTDEEMYAQTARHGMSREDTDLLFKITGRPLSFHQVFIGLQRGGIYDGATADIDPAFLKSLRESNIRPEWYALAWAQRYNYPSAFVLRALTQSGEITQADAEKVLLYEGWEPTFAAKVAKAWATAKGSAAKEASATDLLALYDGGKATGPDTLAALQALGYPADEAQAKLDVLDARRVTSARNAAISDLHAALKKGTLDVQLVAAALPKLTNTPETAQAILSAWQVYIEAFPPAAPAAPTAPAA